MVSIYFLAADETLKEEIEADIKRAKYLHTNSIRKTK